MRKFKEIPESIKEFIGYSKDSPSGLVWVKSPNRKIRVGAPVGCLKPTGYWEIRFNKKEYLAHRVVFFLTNETCPAMSIIDHIDGDPSNNCKDNLRMASPSESSWNIKGWKDKPSGLPKGVHLNKNKLVAHIMKEGKVFSKRSNNLEDLQNWLEVQRNQKHGEFSNDGKETS